MSIMFHKSTNLSIQQACILVPSLLFLLNFGACGGRNLVHRLPGFPGELPFTLETGYIGIGEEETIQLYYYFVKSQRDPANDPLFLWLTGGPGCSALSGMLYEIGPFQFDYAAYDGALPPLISNPYSFTQIANFIFLDAPVGTGFSFSENNLDYNIKDDIAAADVNYQFLRKWLLGHPRFINNSLYISGDSYSGKIVPILVHQIHKGQKARHVPKMNLKGYVLGNPLTDTDFDNSFGVQFAHRMGFISDELYESVKVNCACEYLNHLCINNALCLKDRQAIKKCLEGILNSHVLEPNCKFAPEVLRLETEGTLRDANISITNVVETLQGKKPWCRSFNYVLSYIWANDPGVQEALHVRKGTKDYWRRCNTTLLGQYPKEVIPNVVEYHRRMFHSGYRALIYSGDHDMLIPYVGTIKWIASLDLALSDPWRPWLIDTQAVGFTKTYKYEDTYELTFTTIKGAGHTAPEYKPKPCLEMLDRWLTNSEL